MWNSLKQDLLKKPTLQSEHQQIGSIHFFSNEHNSTPSVMYRNMLCCILQFPLNPIDIYVIYLTESSLGSSYRTPMYKCNIELAKNIFFSWITTINCVRLIFVAKLRTEFVVHYKKFQQNLT